jgi:GT2 family glycosyltransferase
MPRVAVVIVNWNGAAHLPGCLAALAAQTMIDFACWVVDNGSTDESRTLLDAAGPRLARSAALHVRPHPTNLGFAAANNRAFAEILATTDIPYLVALNNDTAADPGWLAALLAAADATGPRCGSIASTLVFATRPDRVQSAGIALHRDGLALDRGLGWPTARLPRAVARPVFGPSGGAALYRAALLRDIGGFDERFGSYLEDVDLAWRARLLGWGAAWAPQAIVRHAVSATGGQESPFKNYLLARNRLWTIAKNLPTGLLLRWAPLIARYDLLALAYAALRRDPAIIRGRVDALRGLGPILRTRREIQARRRCSDRELAALLAPALSPRQALRARTRLNALLAGPPGE